MIYLIVRSLFRSGFVGRHGLGFLRVFNDDTFQAAAATVVSFAFCMAAGPGVIRWLRRQKIGDQGSTSQADIDRLMASKTGTPTMGGLLIIAVDRGQHGFAAGRSQSNFYVKMALVWVILLGGVGATDDWLKLTVGPPQPAAGRDCTSLEKLLFQIGAERRCFRYFTYQVRSASRARLRGCIVPFLKNVGDAVDGIGDRIVRASARS